MTRLLLIDDPRALLRLFLERGERVIAPREIDGAIAYAPLKSADDLPRGRTDIQAPGQYRLQDGDPDRWFDYVVGPGSWKAWLFPAKRKLWTATRSADGLSFEEPEEPWPPTVFFGVRPCELAAIERQGRVFSDGAFPEPDFARRLSKTLLVVVNCARSAPTCFCASMQTGPRAEAGFDLSLTELDPDHGARFLLESGSEAGERVLADLAGRPAGPEQRVAARAISERTAQSQSRQMPEGIAEGLKDRLESPVWAEIATRCLTCANCTLACPTCFCSDVTEVSDLSGDHAERWQVWDSCFSPDFGFVHGGPVRSSPAARYRQWMTHKLSYWHDQFDSSGCVGCGRCITWCPVGIDIVAEAGRLMAEEGAEP